MCNINEMEEIRKLHMVRKVEVFAHLT